MQGIWLEFLRFYQRDPGLPRCIPLKERILDHRSRRRRRRRRWLTTVGCDGEAKILHPKVKKEIGTPPAAGRAKSVRRESLNQVDRISLMGVLIVCYWYGFLRGRWLVFVDLERMEGG